VIGSDSGEIPWVIKTTGGGLLFPEGDVDALANALLELRADPSIREALAGKGRESVERLFAVSAVGAQLDQVMREVSTESAVV
jgi:glycosyltransferase involved in cell wall biosynthesis